MPSSAARSPQVGGETRPFDGHDVVLDSELPGRLDREWSVVRGDDERLLIVVEVLVREADRERPQPRVRRAGRQRGHESRVETAAQVRSDRRVREEGPLDGARDIFRESSSQP